MLQGSECSTSKKGLGVYSPVGAPLPRRRTASQTARASCRRAREAVSTDRPDRRGCGCRLQAAAQFTPLHSKRIWEGISRDCALQTSKERASQIRTIDFERSLGTRGLHSVTLTCFAESLNVLAHAKSPAMSEQFSSQQKLNEDPSYKSNRINRR